MGEPWYRDGLPFTCTRCGACCTGTPGYVWVTPQEVAAIAEFQGKTAKEVGEKCLRMVGTALSLVERPNGDCAFYDGDAKGCTIYPARPRQCRSWPFWQSNLKTPGTWEETCKICPGAGQGQVRSSQEVEQLVSLIRL